MFKSSITKFLIASLGILMTGLFVAALILAVQAWANYALAGRIGRLTSTDHTLFNALVTVRAQIPKDSTALIAQDDPRLVIGDTHREASLTVGAALEALQATDIANRVQFVTAFKPLGRKRKRCNSPSMRRLPASEPTATCTQSTTGARRYTGRPTRSALPRPLSGMP